jgi:hypothetical protein
VIKKFAHHCFAPHTGTQGSNKDSGGIKANCGGQHHYCKIVNKGIVVRTALTTCQLNFKKLTAYPESF